MSVIPCQQNEELQVRIREFAETLKTQAHQLGNHGLDEQEFYINPGVAPAKAGIQTWPRMPRLWIPAYAGMTQR